MKIKQLLILERKTPLLITKKTCCVLIWKTFPATSAKEDVLSNTPRSGFLLSNISNQIWTRRLKNAATFTFILICKIKEALFSSQCKSESLTGWALQHLLWRGACGRECTKRMTWRRLRRRQGWRRWRRGAPPRWRRKKHHQEESEVGSKRAEERGGFLQQQFTSWRALWKTCRSAEYSLWKTYCRGGGLANSGSKGSLVETFWKKKFNLRAVKGEIFLLVDFDGFKNK